MTEDTRTSAISRRTFLQSMLAVGGTALLGACGSTATPPPAENTGAAAAPTAASSAGAAATAAPAAGGTGDKLLVWGVVSFTKDGDAMLGQQMQEWGAQNNHTVEYVALPGSDYDSKLAAAVESGAQPDIVMMLGTNAIFYASQNRLVELSDIFNEIKGQAGGMFDALFPLVQADGKTYAIPMQSDVSALYARLDLCEQATGKRAAPATLDEMDAIMRKVNAPPKLFGYGLTLGRTPDADGTITQLLIQDGGTLVDKDGNPTLDNPGTVSALTRVQSWWKDKLIPPESPAWDDSSNNKAYQSRQVAFVTNPASIFAYLEQNDKELLADTTQAPWPAGKGGSFPGAGTWSWSIFSASKNIDASKALIKALLQPDKIEAVYEKVGGRWFPVYKDLANAQFWKDRPYFNDFPKILESARPAWFPAAASPKLLTQLSAASQKHIYADMAQDVVVNNKSPEEAAKAAQVKLEQAFAEAAK
jgi:multiple sugar transport system substrate-binding protein